MKVALLLDDTLDKPDGVQQYVLAIGDWLTRRGHEVHYLVGETHRTDLPHIHSLSKNIAVRFNGNSLTIPLPTKKSDLLVLLRQEKFDVLHVQSPHHPFLSHALIKYAPPETAIVATFHILPNNWAAKYLTRLLGMWLRASLKRVHVMLAVSKAAALFEQASFGVTPRILPNTIDLAPFFAARSSENRRIPTVVYLNRLVPRKGSLQLVRAVEYLVNTLGYAKPFQVLIGGKGELTEKLQAYITEHNLASYVSLLGFVPEAEKANVLAQGDVVVYPSTGGESFGIVLLEGMAASRGVVLAGNNPGYSSVMEPFPDQLFDPNDIHGFAVLLKESLHSNKRAARRTTQKKYAQQFDITVVGPQIEAAYADALKLTR